MKSRIIISIFLFHAASVNAEVSNNAFSCRAKEETNRLDYDVTAMDPLKVLSMQATSNINGKTEDVRFVQNEDGTVVVPRGSITDASIIYFRFATSTGLEVMGLRAPDNTVSARMLEPNLDFSGPGGVQFSGKIGNHPRISFSCKSYLNPL